MQTLDKYQVLEKIGVGGFGVVYKAYDPFIKRHVAIKTCTSEETETRERFMREAEIAGNLHHRNIVTVYDFGFKDGVPYLVQEYLSGEDLDRKIKRRDFLTVPEKLLYLVQIARGLQYAHSRGVVHRDIKPANIRILEDDTAKIMDFGIAKLAQHQEALTQAGITLGTAAYLSPEQIRGGAFDARTDLFSYGVLAYELFALERPFQGAEISAVFYKILNEETPALREKAADCPEELERIVRRCLEKDPQRRYPGCSELLHDIEELTHRRPRETADNRAATKVAAETGGGAPARPVEPARSSTTSDILPNARGAATPPPRPLSLGEIELDTRKLPTIPHQEGHTTIAFAKAPSAGKRGGLGLTILVLAAAATWGGWRYWQESHPIPPAPIRTATSSRTSANLAPPAKQVVLAPSPNAAATAPVEAPLPAAVSDAAAPASAALPPAAAPAEAPPPLAPEPAVLTVASAWDSAMTLRLGGKIWTLDRERRLELAAGSYKLKFEIDSPVYRHAQETTVRLKEGEKRQITSPIERPGRLTVQPHINARQAFVRLDGGPAVPTPVRGLWVAPGPHVVDVVATQDPESPVLRQESIRIRSEYESILTFDLDGHSPQRLAEKPVVPN